MATATKPTLKEDLRACNHCLDAALRSRFGMGLKAYRTIKAATQLVGAAAGIYAMSLGAPPLASFAMIAAIISGPELAEHILTAGEPTDRNPPSSGDQD